MTLHTLLILVLQLAVVGVCLYLVERFIPMDSAIRVVIRVVVVIAVVLWILSRLGGL